MEFKRRRQALIQKLGQGAMAILPAAKEVFRSGDTHYPFRQNSDFYYFTGFNEPDAIALLTPGHSEGEFILFNRNKDKAAEIWTGYRAGQIGAVNDYQADSAYPIDSFFERIAAYFSQYSEIVAPWGVDDVFDTQLHRIVTQMGQEKRKGGHAPVRFVDITSHTHEMRLFKDEGELACMKQAAQISTEAHIACIEQCRPGMFEYELEAILTTTYYKYGCRTHAYPPIVGSGSNSCVLHYIENNQQCKADDLILLDVAAEYATYKSDLTRTVPVSGKFSDRQKAVYNAVNHVKKEATKMLLPGTLWKEYHVEVGKIMTSELLKLGLIDKADVQNEDKDWPAYKKYFMHGTSHHIGLDTHDYGLLHEPMQANNVFTVEPGIYIPKEGFGIRLEDDVVIQEKGEPFNLMGNIPIEAAEIEDIMQG